MTDTSKATSRHLLINARSAQLNAMGRNAVQRRDGAATRTRIRIQNRANRATAVAVRIRNMSFA